MENCILIEIILGMIRKIYRTLIRISATRYQKKINLLISLLNPKDGINFIDVGAAGQIIPRWKRIEKYVNYYGFEPDKRSREELLAQENNCKSYYLDSKIISNKSEVTEIHLCKAPMTSSVYAPNRSFVDLFAEAERFDIVSKEKLNATTIDKLEIENIDFIKLDIQGGELNALKGAEKTLNNCLGLEIEVEFLPIYKNQPLYADITNFLKKHQFEFIDFLRICRWERNNIYTNMGQAAWGDGLYLKTPEFVAKNIIDTDMIKRYIVICLIYHKIDLIISLLDQLKDRSIVSSKFTKRLLRFDKRLKKSKWLKERFNNLTKLFIFIDEEIHLFN